ncbi:13428_t:CDS:1, partial [Entrophospora sp. SA101]
DLLKNQINSIDYNGDFDIFNADDNIDSSDDDYDSDKENEISSDGTNEGFYFDPEQIKKNFKK